LTYNLDIQAFFLAALSVVFISACHLFWSVFYSLWPNS